MISVVVPTIREDSYSRFYEAWKDLFRKHDVNLIVVHDGDIPTIGGTPASFYMGEDYDLLYNKNDGVRNAGFYYIAKTLPETEYIITLDDDVLPIGDPIQDHINALNMRVSTSWISTASEYTRGFPYGVRSEAEVVLSHGVWEGVADWDAPTQLINGNKPVEFYKGAIPVGTYYPMCGMNIAFKRKMLPYMYYAPMGYKVGMDRFADIWLGIVSKRVIDENEWAVVTGYSKVLHERASNVWKNLQKEARGLELNEGFWQGEEDDPYFKLYKEQRERWRKTICDLLVI